MTCENLIFYILTANSIRDISKREVCFFYSLLMAAAGSIQGLLSGRFTPLALILALLPGGLVILLSIVSRGKIGMGDGIVLLSLGAWSHFFYTVTLLMLGLLLAALAAWILSRLGKGKKALPFIPFLLAACFLEEII